MKKVIIRQADYALVKREGDVYKVHYEPQVMLNTDCSPSEDYIVAQEVFHSLPNIFQIKAAVDAYINADTDRKILSGFTYNGHRVWLSLEDQMNYKGAYDLCVQTGGQGVLPLTIKIGTTDNPHYETFDTVEGFTAFYLSMFAYIQQTLSAGWAKKDAVNYEEYDTALRAIAANDND